MSTPTNTLTETAEIIEPDDLFDVFYDAPDEDDSALQQTLDILALL